jgi:hypothetical protein
MDELAFRRSPYQIVMSLAKWKLVVPFLFIDRNRYFVSMTATAEYPISNNHVVT